MKRLFLVMLGVTGFVTIAHLQSDPAQAIRAHVAQIDTSATGLSRSDTEADAVVWTGAYARPIVGATRPDPKDFVAVPNRRNIQNKTTIERIVVSQDRTMAYEYSSYTLTFDDESGHQTRNGALLRVWRNTGTDWKISADFQRPYGRVQTTW